MDSIVSGLWGLRTKVHNFTDGESVDIFYGMTDINKIWFWDCSTDLKTWIQLYLRWYISSDQEGMYAHVQIHMSVCRQK